MYKYLLVFAMAFAVSQDQRPTLYIIGDSTVKNGKGKGDGDLWGWGSILDGYFDTTRIAVRNFALGGRSSRTFITEGHWDQVLEQLKPGDYVIMQFGHNDGGPLDDTARARGTLKGTGEETQDIYNPIMKRNETVHTFGWYMRKYVNDAKAKGATPIICSPIPRNMFSAGHVLRNGGDYGGWSAATAVATGAYFIHLNELIADVYDRLGEDSVKGFFPGDHTHTNAVGARLNAEMVVKGIRGVEGLSLRKYLRRDSLGKIDRHVVIGRHDPVNEKADPLGALSVGNGRFAFTVDVTGLQSFPEAYDAGIPLGTESEWGWHSLPDTAGYRYDETLRAYNIHGREITYSVQLKNKAVDYYRENPHRLQLGNIGLELTKQDGTLAALSDLHDIHQELILWAGEIRSHFTLQGVPVDISTVAHPDQDAVAFSIRSPLTAAGRLQVRVRLPYPTAAFTDNGDNWGDEGRHRSFLLSTTDSGAVLRHDLDTTHYYVSVGWSGMATIRERQPHYFIIHPGTGDVFSFGCRFSKGAADQAELWPAVRSASAAAWAAYWTKGAIVDFSGSTDPRATELERRIVLSQYLTRIQDAGDVPPQETGLTYNSWYGRPHLEMHWWHAAHFALWGHPELLERSLDWYLGISGKARAIARRQGYEGLRWPKMTDGAGGESPSSVGAFLIWQQPHFIYMAELCYRAERGAGAAGTGARSGRGRSRERPISEAGAMREDGAGMRANAVLKRYSDMVFATADFMASYAWYDSATHRYILGPELIPAQERFGHDSTINPCFELAYWRWALTIAQQWRVRLGMKADAGWQRVIDGLAELPQHNGLYYPTEDAADAYTNPRYRGDHPAVLATYGFLPATKGVDTAVMHATFNWVVTNWDWQSTWGWDFPLMAMTATRLGSPGQAIDALLMPVAKNTYLTSGHNYQDERLRLYLPGNGGLLAAVALMCAGYDGCQGADPGFPKDGGWRVRWEGLRAMP